MVFVHGVQRVYFLLDEPLSHPFTSAIRLVECVMTNTSSDNLQVLFCAEHSADRFVHSLDLMVQVATVWHVFTDKIKGFPLTDTDAATTRSLTHSTK